MPSEPLDWNHGLELLWRQRLCVRIASGRCRNGFVLIYRRHEDSAHLEISDIVFDLAAIGAAQTDDSSRVAMTTMQIPALIALSKNLTR